MGLHSHSDPAVGQGLPGEGHRLATIAGKKPKNFFHFLLDNECYATTGGQPVPNAEEINYAGVAKEAGYAAAYSFTDLEEFATSVDQIMKETGPVFVAIKVVPEVENEQAAAYPASLAPPDGTGLTLPPTKRETSTWAERWGKPHRRRWE